MLIRRFGIGIYCFQGSPLIRRNTIVECGLGRLARGGIECDFGSTPRIEQNIIAWNVGAALRVSPDSHPVVACNDLFENGGGDQVLGVDGGGNIHLDPLFCNPLAGELGLRPDSPCAAAPGCGVIGALDIACPASPVEPATWGAIKARLRDWGRARIRGIPSAGGERRPHRPRRPRLAQVEVDAQPPLVQEVERMPERAVDRPPAA